MSQLNSKLDERRIVSVDSPGMKRVRNVLAAATEPIDGKFIAEQAHISFTTFANTYRHLLLRANLMHIAGWRNNWRGPFVPLYANGPLIGKPPVKPKKLDQLARAREWKERTGYNDMQKAQRRLQRPPDTALAALMGLPARYHKQKARATDTQQERNSA